MRKIIAAIAWCLVCATTFAEAPELKNMMPNSWKKLTRLLEAEERGILESVQVKNDISTLESVGESRVYKESVNGVDFYRVLSCNEAIPDFLAEDYKDKTVSREYYDDFIRHKIHQIVYLKETYSKLSRLIDLGFREFGVMTSDYDTEDAYACFVFEDLFIKKLNKNEIGFFITQAAISFPLSYDDASVDLVYGGRKNQQMGGNSAWFSKCNIKDDIASAWDREVIYIESPAFLFDPKCPLRYSIQNAFDGDPATSYVENTEDDLMRITFRRLNNIGTNLKTTFAIINGYATNKDLYAANNRIRKCGIGNNDAMPFIADIDDNIMTRQIKTINRPEDAYTGMFVFVVTDIYKGSKYNDTCMAELNFYDNVEKTWLFGDIDE